MLTVFAPRLADLHRAMHGRVLGQDEEEDRGQWPPGLRDSKGGKKADILKLVSEAHSLYLQPNTTAFILFQGMLILCMAEGNPSISFPPTLPGHLPASLRDFLGK